MTEEMFLDDMQQGMMRPPNPRNLPPHQRLFQNEFCHGPPTGPPHQMAQQGRPNGYQAQSIQGKQICLIIKRVFFHPTKSKNSLI